MTSAGDTTEFGTTTGFPDRVLHVMNAPSGGAARTTISIIEGLANHGIQSAIYCHGTGTEPDAPRLTDSVDGRISFGNLRWWNRKIRASRVKRPAAAVLQTMRTGFGVASSRRVAAFARAQGVQLIHTNTVLTREGAIAAGQLGLPHVWHVRELVGPGMPFRFWAEHIALPRRVGRHADVIVANSSATADALARFLPESMISTVPNGITDARLNMIGAPRGVPPTVGMVADVRSRSKGHHAFVQAAAMVRHPGAKFVLFGDVPPPGTDRYSDRLHADVARLGLTDRFTFKGRSPDIAANMAAIDILVHPSPFESFGRIVLEAMLAGRPVVGVAAGGVGELVEDAHTGLCAPTADPAALALRIDQLCDDVDLRVAYGQAGRIRGSAHFSAEQMVDGILDAYRVAIARHATTQATATAP